MRITKEESIRMALALDTAISCMECDEAPTPKGISKSLRDDSLIHLRVLRSAALRANREAPADVEQLRVRLQSEMASRKPAEEKIF